MVKGIKAHNKFVELKGINVMVSVLLSALLYAKTQHEARKAVKEQR